MKKAFLLLISLILLTSYISADILVTQEPNSNYNLGDIVNIPIKVTSASEINNFLKIYLICNGAETEVHKEYILLEAGEETESIIKIPLITSFTSRTAGNCVIKTTLGNEYILTKEFEVSNIITIELTENTKEVIPGKSIIIKGEAKKGNGANAKGFIDVSLIQGDSEKIKFSDTINKGYFELNLTIPKNFAAGEYLIKLEAYEKDIEGEITNQGLSSSTVLVKQVPTSLEIAFEESNLEPGETLQVKAILHDQTGEKINSNAKIIITNENGKLISETEMTTSEIYEYNIPQNQKPGEWKVKGISEDQEGESYFKIITLEKIETTIINKTVLIKNVGNVLYNNTVIIKIGEESIPIKTILEIGQEEKYVLSAPNGEYEIEIMGEKQKVILTGAAIGAKKIGGISTMIQYPLVWIFIIGILGFVSYLFFKKGYNKTFIGYITRKKGEPKEVEGIALRKNSLVKSNNKAELSLSIKGTKQPISLICLKIKNLKDIEQKKGDIEATIQQIVTIAEDNKAVTYENQDNIFFLFVPLKTKTFRNEKTSIQTAQNIKKILDHANKLFKDKIEYGISLNYGNIVAKQESGSLKFMSLGTLTTEAKRISSESNGEIFLSEEIRDKSLTEIKTEKVIGTKTPAYKLKEIKLETEDNKKFISSFIKRLEKK